MRTLLLVLLLVSVTGLFAEPKAEETKRVGYLAEQIQQHPIVTSPLAKQKQFYFDVGEKPGSGKQIIVVYPEKMNIPTEKGRQLELSGTVQEISLGGKPGTKRSYKNEVLTLKRWRYLEAKADR